MDFGQTLDEAPLRLVQGRGATVLGFANEAKGSLEASSHTIIGLITILKLGCIYRRYNYFFPEISLAHLSGTACTKLTKVVEGCDIPLPFTAEVHALSGNSHTGLLDHNAHEGIGYKACGKPLGDQRILSMLALSCE